MSRLPVLPHTNSPTVMPKKSFFRTSFLPHLTGIAALALSMSQLPSAEAASGTWTLSGNGTWSDPANWASGVVADGAGNTANFGLVSQAPTITLDTSRTIGGLNFNYPVGSPAYTFVGDGIPALTLRTLVGAPTINVVTGTINLGSTITASSIALAGNQGFEKTGAGRLNILMGSATNSTLSGNIIVSGGSLNIQGLLSNVSVTLGTGTTFFIGNTGGALSQIQGLNSGSGAGTVSTGGNSRNLVLVGDGDYSYGGVFTGGGTSSSVNVVASLTGGGSQTFTNIGANYNATTVNSGALISVASASSGTPFGVGNVTLGVGANGSSELRLSPAGVTGAVSYTGASAAVGTTFTYGNGAHLVLDKGAADSLTYTIGNSAAAQNSVLVRSSTDPVANSSNNGSLIITPVSGLANLGTSNGERFIVNGGVALVNTIVNSSIIGRDNDANASGSFLTYDATDGFKVATYSSSADINGGVAFADTRVFDATASSNNVLTNNSSVFALRASGTISGAFTLSVGANASTAPGAVILNGGSINTSTLAFGTDAAGLIYTSLAGGTINAAITNGTANEARGVTFEGPGVLTLGGNNTFRGGAFINDTIISISSNQNLGAALGATNLGQVSLKGGTIRTTASLTFTNRQINLLPGVGDGGGTFDITTGVATFTSGSNGKIIGGVGSLTKTGQGTLLLGGTADNTYSGGTIVKAGTLSVQRSGALGTGGVLLVGTGSSAATMGTLLIGGTTTLTNAVTFSGGAAQRVVNAGATYSLGTTGAVRSSFAGGISTGASLLEAQSATAQTTINYSFSNLAPVGALNDSIRGSDVFSLSNMESGKMFTLQLSIDSVISENNSLLWYDSATNLWVNAVLGNSNAGTMGLTGFQGDGAYNAGSDFVLGYWGYDSANKVVWAVLDHNSQFALSAVPEPGTTAMVAIGLGMMLFLVRRQVRARRSAL